MSNFTIEDYRNAIKAKFEKEIEEGDYPNNLSSPTTANLRNLCIKRFMSNNNKDDLTAFECFFDFPFDKDKKNLFGDDELNKLEAVKRFFLGKTEKPSEDTVQLAAILVDLQPRPFSKFRKQIDGEDQELINELRVNNNSDKEVSSDNLRDKAEIKDLNDSIADDVVEKPQSLQSKKTNSTEIPTDFVNIDEKPKSKKMRYLAITVVLAGLGLIIYLTLSKSHKECMQWSNDHYDEVSCDLEVQGTGTFNAPEPYDARIINLRKIQVCDTTVFFKNEKPVVWYAKTANGIDFFNTHGMHPETGKALRPITQYIISRYVKSDCK